MKRFFIPIFLITTLAIVLVVPNTCIAIGNLGINEPPKIDTSLLTALGGVIGIIMGVGTVVAICASIYLGIRYILSSVEEKAEIKKKMVPFIIGVAIFYGATGILKIIGEIAKQL